MTSSQHNSDERDLLDFADAVSAGENPQPTNDIERTYLHVQRALQGTGAAIPSTTKQSTWEDVMSTVTLAPDAPVSNRTRREQPRPLAAFQPKRLQWTPLASIAAAVLVILASFGVWFTSGDEEPPTPPLAPQLAGITSSGEIAQVPGTPEATAVETETGTVSVPIINGMDEQPMAGPVIWLTTSGDVMYDDGSLEVTTIATNATSVAPVTTNVIKVITDDPEGDWTGKDGQEYDGYKTTYHHLISGKTLVDDNSFSSLLGGPNTFGSLQVLTISDAPQEWSIVNFEMMESKSIAEITGGQFRSSDPISVAVSNDLSTIAIGTSQYQSEASQILVQQSGLPGQVAVIPADLSSVSWVSVPEDVPAVGNIYLSPNGSEVAFISTENQGSGSSMTVSIVDVVTNEELMRTEQIDSEMIIHFQWLPTNDGFVILTRESVQRFLFDGSEPTVLFESESSIDQMPSMVGSDMIYLSVWSNPSGMGTPDPATSQLVILNPTTGETITVDGKPWFMGGSYPMTFSTSLAPIPVSQDGSDGMLVHPITGEVLSDVVADVGDGTTDVASGEPMVFLQSVSAASDAPVSAVRLADGNIAIVTTTADSFEVRIVPGGEGINGLQINLSPDGSYAMAGNSYNLGDGESVWLLDLTDPESEWVQQNPNTPVYFVELRDE